MNQLKLKKTANSEQWKKADSGLIYLSISTLLIHAIDIGMMNKVNPCIDIYRDTAVRDELVAVCTGAVETTFFILTELVTVAPF